MQEYIDTPENRELLEAKLIRIMAIDVDAKKYAKFLLNEVKGYENKYKKRIWDVMPAWVMRLLMQMEAGGIIDRKRVRILVEDAFRENV